MGVGRGGAIRRVKPHLASHNWLVFGQNLPKQVNLLRAQLQELEDVLHAGVHGELGAPLRRLQLAGVPHDFRRWLQRQVQKNASTSGEAAGHPRRSSPTPPDLRLWPRSPRRGDSDWFSLCRQASEDLTPVQTPPTPGKVRSTHDNFEKTNRALIDANDNW